MRMQVPQRNGHRQSRKLKKFVPMAIAGSGGARLEARALTVPLIYRQPAVDAVAAGDYAQAWVNDIFPGDVQEFIAHESQVLSGVDPTTLSTITSIATVDAEVIDVANTFPPALPNGNSGITMNTAAQLQLSSSGPINASPFPATNAIGQTRRAYVLADNGDAPSGGLVTLVETFEVHYDPGASKFGIYGMAAQLTTPTTTVQALGGWGPGLTINGTNYFDSSGTITNPNGSVITYSQSTTDWNITISTPMIVPAATRDPVNGQITGTNWLVITNAGVNVNGINAISEGSDQTSVTTQYTMDFV